MSAGTTTEQPNVREWAYRYTLDHGMYVLSVPYLSKNPGAGAWQAQRLAVSDIEQHFNGHKQNIGVLLGIAQEGCLPYIDIDLDSMGAVRLAPDFLPQTGMKFGRKSKPKSHWLYTCEQPPITKEYKDPIDNEMLLELRALKHNGEVGRQTIIPPSVRGRDEKKDPPNYEPERIEWHSFGEAGNVIAPDLTLCVDRLAAATLLAKHYPGVGARDTAAMALSGGLLRGGWAEDEARDFIHAIASEADDEETASRVGTVADTARKLAEGHKVTGWPTLVDILGERVVQKVREWLGVLHTSDAHDASDATSQDSSKRQPSQATRLVELAATLELWHTPEGEAYATIPVSNHREHRPLRGKQCKMWLARMYYETTRTVAGAQALQDALAALEGRALFDGAEYQTYIRVARHEGAIYLDMANDAWQAIRISTTGWEIVDEPPIRFRRAKGLLALHTPVRGGCLSDLWKFVPVKDADKRALLLAFLVACMRPEGPYPDLVLSGEQGSAKSTAARVLKALIDPSSSPLRSEPRTGQDLMIAANNSWLLAFDNLSHIQPWLSDALCRLSTGGGFATRELYADAEETIFDAQRPVILTSIEDVTTRSDLLDRSVVVQLQALPKEMRRPESQLWAEFDEKRPAMLGCLLDAVSTAMRNLPDTHVANLPRMADFALWATAAEPALELKDGDFMRAYRGNREDANALALESDPIAAVVQAFLKADAFGVWRGTATGLLAALNTYAGYGFGKEEKRPPQGWPKRGDKLSGSLRRLAPNLRAVGVDVSFERTGSRGRAIVLRTVAQSSVTDDTSDTFTHETAQTSDATGDDGDAKSAVSDATSGTSDASDASFHDYSDEWDNYDN